MSRYLALGLLISSLIPTSTLSDDAACNYDCSSPHPNQYGPFNFNNYFTSFPNPSAKAYSIISSLPVCDTPSTVQPQTVKYRSTDFTVVLCDNSVKVLSLNSTDGTLSIHEEVDLPVQGDHDMLLSFGSLFVTSEGKLQYFDVNNMTQTWSIDIDGIVATSTPMHGVSNVLVFSNEGKSLTAVSAITGEINNEINLAEANVLRYGVVADNDVVYYCSGDSLVKVADSKISSLPLGSGKECTSIILSEQKTVLLALVDSNENGELVEVNTETGFSDGAQLPKASTFLKGRKVHAMSRYVYQPGPVGGLVLSTSEGVEVLNVHSRDANVDRGTVLKFMTTKQPVVTPVAVSILGEPAFGVEKGLTALSLTYDQRMTFFNGDDAINKEAQVVYPEASRRHAPLLQSSSHIVALSDNGNAVVYKYCMRYNVDEPKPERNACPVADLPDAEGLPTGVVIAASASAVLCLPMGMYLCRKTKYDSGEEE